MPELDMKAVNQAVEDVNKAFLTFKETNDARLAEIEAKGAADALLTEKIDRIEADLQKAQAIADEAVVAAKRAARFGDDASGKAEAVLEAKARRFEMEAQGFFDHPVKGTMPVAEIEAYQKTMVDRYWRKGVNSLTEVEKKALSVGGDPDGGYVVHPDMSGRIVKQEHETSPMRAYASIQTISTDALEGVFDLNQASAGWVGETAARTETNTPQIGVWRIPVHEIYANPAATQKLLDDAAMDMEAWLAMHVADEFAREENTAFVNGNGVSKPRGFLTYADGTTLPGTIEQFDTGVNGDFKAAPDGADTLLDALYALKDRYRANATWFSNRATQGAFRKEKDSNGQMIWVPGAAAGQPATLLGYPTASFEDMPDIATGSLSIAVGDMRAAYQIVDRVGIRVLRDPYSNKPYVHFYTTKRTGGDVVNFEALKLINFQA